ncbi:MAG: hypothetical protein ACRDZQ_00020 [Acidimicrobiales bacterium]
MKTFAVDPAAHAEAWRRQGWVHITNGVSAEFLAHLVELNQRCQVDAALSGQGIQGAKDQWMYEPPDGDDLVGELFDMVSALCGLRRETLTLSERHLKRYSKDADPDPPAHKDRYASQVAVGISIEVAPTSCLALYPFDHRDVNPFLTGALRQTLGPDQLPEVALREARSIEIADRPGDVLVFPGSSMWHLRRRSAGTANLYLKCNDFDCDPLGEDPTTDTRRRSTDDLLAIGSRDELARAIPVLSRRLEWVGRLAQRAWHGTPAVKVWDRPVLPVSEPQMQVLEALDGVSTWKELSARVAGDGMGADLEAELVGLARRGAIDLLAPGSAGVKGGQ